MASAPYVPEPRNQVSSTFSTYPSFGSSALSCSGFGRVLVQPAAAPRAKRTSSWITCTPLGSVMSMRFLPTRPALPP